MRDRTIPETLALIERTRFDACHRAHLCPHRPRSVPTHRPSAADTLPAIRARVLWARRVGLAPRCVSLVHAGDAFRSPACPSLVRFLRVPGCYRLGRSWRVTMSASTPSDWRPDSVQHSTTGCRPQPACPSPSPTAANPVPASVPRLPTTPAACISPCSAGSAIWISTVSLTSSPRRFVWVGCAAGAERSSSAKAKR